MDLPDDQLKSLTLGEMNSGLRCYREDLRYTRADANRFAALWNQHKLYTRATVVTVDGFPCIVVLDA